MGGRRRSVKCGVTVDGESDPSTNLRFADDLLLTASSKPDAVKMLGQLQQIASKYGSHGKNKYIDIINV